MIVLNINPILMKTAVIMYRDLNGIKIRQNHKTSCFNANDLLELYNTTTEKKADMHSYLRSKQFKKFKNEVIKDILQNTQKIGILKSSEESHEMDMIFLDETVCQVKRGKNGGTWLHPFLFMDFAMWLSPEFKLTCIKWIYDKLIQVRDECGDTFKEVNDALFNKKPNTAPFEYANEARMINKIVFGNQDKGQRNGASEQQLDMLKNLQKIDIGLIKEGKEYFERYEELKRYALLLYPQIS